LAFQSQHRFIHEDEPTDQEHLGQIPQTQLVTQPPAHHELNDIAQILHTVEHTGAAVIELLGSVPHSGTRGSLPRSAQAAG
jgi:hypothetical protein